MNNHDISSIIGYGFLGATFLFLLLNKVFPSEFLKLGFFVWLAIIAGLISIIILFLSWLILEPAYEESPVQTLKGRHSYFDKIGYGLFIAGLVSFATSEDRVNSIGIIILGVICMIIGGYNGKKVREFEELIKENETTKKQSKTSSKQSRR